MPYTKMRVGICERAAGNREPATPYIQMRAGREHAFEQCERAAGNRETATPSIKCVRAAGNREPATPHIQMLLSSERAESAMPSNERERATGN